MKIMRSTRLKQIQDSVNTYSTIMNTIPPSNYKLVIIEDSFSDFSDFFYYIRFRVDELYIYKNIIDLIFQIKEKKNITQIELFNKKFDISYYDPSEEDKNFPGNSYQNNYAYKITNLIESFHLLIKGANSKQVEYKEWPPRPPRGGIKISKNQDLSSLLVRII
jgi:hypothetical protein